MKKIVILTSLIFAGVSCGTEKPEAQKEQVASAVSVIADVTDPHVLTPVANPLLQLYRSEAYPDAASSFRLRSISDRMITYVASAHLLSGEVTEKQNTGDDPQFRRKNIAAFQKRVRQLVADFYENTDTSQSLGNSESIRTIADELQYLSSVRSANKYLVVFSDLNEKSDLCDVYDTDNPGATIERALLQKGMFPERLDGITIFFVFSPVDRTKDIQYRHIAGAYKKVCEERGGRVFIQANSDVFEL